MRKLLLIAIIFLSGFAAAQAQTRDVTDSLVYRKAADMDSTLVGKSIFNMLPLKSKGGEADVKVHQSQTILNAFNSHVASNKGMTRQGYRVRIFFDNHQNARTQSEKIEKSFKAAYPGISAYRSYENPFFKVTVGDFRTRSEAMQLLNELKATYPKAFLVKEQINYPTVDRKNSFVVDTVRVARGEAAL
jgi:hypothetical protein